MARFRIELKNQYALGFVVKQVSNVGKKSFVSRKARQEFTALLQSLNEMFLSTINMVIFGLMVVGNQGPQETNDIKSLGYHQWKLNEQHVRYFCSFEDLSSQEWQPYYCCHCGLSFHFSPLFKTFTFLLAIAQAFDLLPGNVVLFLPFMC